LLLPLWAGMLEAGQARAILRSVLLDPARFLRTYGLTSAPGDDPEYAAAADDPRGGVNPALNLLLGEALIRYGLRQEAADLVGRLLRGSIECLRRDHAFRSALHPDTGAGLGRRHDVLGIPPLSLLLDVLGVGLLSPDGVRLRGRSPMEQPVVVRWRGMAIARSQEETHVRFPDGTSALVKEETPVLVERIEDPRGESAPIPGTPT
jgi:hypothetical protein